jgi:hypothetical protein
MLYEGAGIHIGMYNLKRLVTNKVNKSMVTGEE